MPQCELLAEIGLAKDHLNEEKAIMIRSSIPLSSTLDPPKEAELEAQNFGEDSV